MKVVRSYRQLDPSYRLSWKQFLPEYRQNSLPRRSALVEFLCMRRASTYAVELLSSRQISVKLKAYGSVLLAVLIACKNYDQL